MAAVRTATEGVRRSTAWSVSVLFLAAAAVVVWQTRRVGVLWDISYVLNTATRIAHGDLPYKDFPLLHPPGTFLVQATMIKVFGAHYVVQIAYTAALAGASVALTFLIVRALVEGHAPHATALSFCLCLPLVLLSTHAIFPQPFYDADVGFVVLASMCCAFVTRRREYPPSLCWLLGASLVLPVFFKQNVGVPFFVLMHVTLAASALRERGAAARGYRTIVLSSLLSLAVAALAIQLTVGVHAYLHWTVTVAGSRRLATDTLELHRYRTHFEVITVVTTLAGGALLVLARNAAVRIGAGVVILLPYLYVAARYRSSTIFLDLWPMVLVLGCIASVVLVVRRQPLFESLVPVVVIGTAVGAFLAQGVEGSSFGVWPLLVVDLAVISVALCEVAGTRRSSRNAQAVEVVVALSGLLIIAPAAHYVVNEVRLSYAKIYVGPIARSKTPALRGLSARGPYLGRTDDIVTYVKAHIPGNDAAIVFPGEDPIFFALDRRPLFPVLNFDATTNPYDAEQLKAMSKKYDVKWLLVKDDRDLQLYSAQVPQADQVLEALEDGFHRVATVGGYLVLRLGPDTTPPVSSLLYPFDRMTLRGTTALGATASDDLRVRGVEFDLSRGGSGGVRIATAARTSIGWYASWDTTAVPDGTYTLTSVAYDLAGNPGRSSARTVTVRN